MGLADAPDRAGLDARFRAAESGLYPLVMADPDLFERATTLVGLVAADLRDCHDVSEVLAGMERSLAGLPALARGAGIDLTDVPLTVVVDAAGALRCRELPAEEAVALARRRLEEARAEGRSWLVEESPMEQVVAGVHWRRELHVATGATLVTTMRADGGDGDGDGDPAYALEVRPGDPPLGVVPVRESFADREAWLAASARRRTELDGVPQRREP